jgi:hypothetical protein
MKMMDKLRKKRNPGVQSPHKDGIRGMELLTHILNFSARYSVGLMTLPRDKSFITT